LVALAAACGGEDSYDGLLKPPSANDGMQLYMKVHLEPGQEMTVCKNFAIPSGSFDIGRFEHAMTGASHHLLVYPLLLASTEVTDSDVWLDCDENDDAQRDRIGMMYGTQSPTGEVKFPKGYAFGAMGGLAVQVEFHLLNATDEPFDAEAAINLWRTREEIIGDAGTLFAFNDWIYVPPMSSASARQRCPLADSVKLMNLVPHMHSRGVAMTVDVDRGGNGTLERVLDVHSWHDETVEFDPPLELAKGDVLDIQCHYDNQTTEHVFDGSSAKHSEMCVTGGLYYRDGARIAIRDEACVGRGTMWTGTKSCTEVQQCMQGLDYSNWNTVPTPGQLYQGCHIQACETGGQAFETYNTCRWNKCRTMCFVNATDDGATGIAFDAPECTSCVDAMCATERTTCSTATCN